MSETESQLVRNILKYLNGLPDCVAEKIHGNIFQSGKPDITGCFKGQAFRIEVKDSEHYKPTQKQLLNLERWGRVGAIAFVAYTLEDVKFVFPGDYIQCKKDCLAVCPVETKNCFNFGD